MNAITCDDLVFRRGDRTVLNRIGFELAPGRLLGLIGHNGAGKSTLIKLILGLLKPASGRLEVLGRVRRAPRPLTWATCPRT